MSRLPALLHIPGGQASVQTTRSQVSTGGRPPRPRGSSIPGPKPEISFSTSRSIRSSTPLSSTALIPLEDASMLAPVEHDTVGPIAPTPIRDQQLSLHTGSRSFPTRSSSISTTNSVLLINSVYKMGSLLSPTFTGLPRMITTLKKLLQRKRRYNRWTQRNISEKAHFIRLPNPSSCQRCRDYAIYTYSPTLC